MSRYLAFRSCLLAMIVPLLVLTASAEISGDRGRRVIYRGSLQLGTEQPQGVEFSIELEPVVFLINSVQNKYKVVRIRMENPTRTDLRLLDEDRIEMRYPEGVSVSGHLDLQRVDPQFWDAFDASQMLALAYPQVLRGRETIYVHAFFPSAQVKNMPVEFEFVVGGKTVRIARPPATAARR